MNRKLKPKKKQSIQKGDANESRLRSIRKDQRQKYRHQQVWLDQDEELSEKAASSFFSGPWGEA